VVKQCKRLQDQLGDLNDAHVLSDELGDALETAAAEQARRLHELAREDPGGTRSAGAREVGDPIPGLLELTRRVELHARRLFGKLGRDWLVGGIEGLRADGPTEVGTTLTFTARGKERTSEITAVDDGRSVTLRSSQGNATADYAYGCRPDGDGGTLVTLVADCRTEGVVLGAVAPLLRMMMKRSDGGQLESLKAVVETG